MPILGFVQVKKNKSLLRSGNKYYQEQQFAKAAEEYLKASDADPDDSIAKYNRAAAVYKQEPKVEAAKLYTTLINTTKGKDMRAKSYYNKAVVLTREKNLEESIEAYKNALRN